MPRKDAQGDVLQCSFCGKSPEEVQRLIAGPTAYICDECIDLCSNSRKASHPSNDTNIAVGFS